MKLIMVFLLMFSCAFAVADGNEGKAEKKRSRIVNSSDNFIGINEQVTNDPHSGESSDYWERVRTRKPKKQPTPRSTVYQMDNRFIDVEIEPQRSHQSQ